MVAIYGPWGSGKTTLLNFLFYYFKQAPVDEQPIIVPFNPCGFPGTKSWPSISLTNSRPPWPPAMST